MKEIIFYMKSGNSFSVKAKDIEIKLNYNEIVSYTITEFDRTYVNPLHIDCSQIEAILIKE